MIQNCTSFNSHWTMYNKAEMRSRFSAPRRGRGTRAGLEPQTVIAAARRVVAGNGLEALTMRRLAGDLAVAPNAVYSYFPDKAALVDALIDEIVGEVEAPDPQSLSWREGLMRLMLETRRVLLANRDFVPLMISRPGRGQNAIGLGEITLQLLMRGGFGDRHAARALRALLVYTFGFVAVELPRSAQREPDKRHALSQKAFASAAVEFPNMARLAPIMARAPSDAEFRAGISALLAGLKRDAAGH